MAEAFDPYHKWLGISPKDQPPNHYRLLGIELFESDPDVIEGAADQRMSHVRTFQSGQNSALSQRILNELSAAKLCLLDVRQRAEYDRQLQAKLQEAAQASEPQRPPAPQAPRPLPQAKPIAEQEPAPIVISDSASPVSVIHKRATRKSPAWRQPAALAGVGVAVLALGAAIYVFSSGSKANVAQANRASATATEEGAAPPAPEPANPKPANPKPAEPDRPAPAVPLATVAAPPKAPELAGEPIDVLKRIDLNRDAVAGDWQMTDGVLVSPDAPFSRLLLPAVPAPEYQLTIAGERVKGAYGLAVALALDGSQVLAEVDGVDGTFAGLSLIDGKNPSDNETGRHGRLLVDGKAFTLVYTVRRNRVQVSLDGGALIDWRGDPSRWSIVEGFKLPDASRLALCEYQSVFHINKIELAPLRPEPEAKPPAVLAGEPIDVLKQIDPKRDAVAGDWQLIDGVLVSPDTPFSRLMLPAPPSPEYQLTVVAERAKGDWGLATGLVIDGRQVTAGIDCFDGHHAGLELLDGKGCNDNESTLQGRLLVDGRPSTLVYTVRRDGVEVTLDGRTVIDWHGDPNRLSMIEDWKIPDPARLSLNTFKTVCRISKIELAPLSPQPEAKPPAVLAGEPIDVLKQIDLKRDAQWGDWRIEGSALFAPAMANSRLQAPVVPPDEYKLTLVAKGEPITRDIVLALPIAGRQALLVLDGWSGTPSTLIQLVDGKPEPNNDTTVNHRVLADGENEIVCTVRKTSIDVECNGKRVIQWSGDPARLVNDRDVPSAKHLYLYSWSTPFRVSRFELTPLIENSSAAPAQAATGVGGTNRPRNLGDLAAGAESRSPPPDEAAEKKARQEVRKTFAAELAAAKTPGEKRKLAEKFIKLARETQDDGASVYVLLREAAELGEAAGDLDLAWEAIDELARSHAIDAIALKQQSLTEVGKAAKSPQQAREMADDACQLMADTLAAGQPAAVKKIAAQAQSFAKQSKDAPLVKEVGIRTRDAAKWAAEFAEATAARETLTTKPDDPGANLTVGRYELCAAKDWKQALPKLAKGGDANWRKTAKDELELARDPATPQRQIAAGDGWWELAEKEPWPGGHYLRMRAAEWYRRAQPSLAAKDKARVDERLKALLAEDDGLPAWELFDNRGGQNRGSYVRLPNGRGLRTPVDYDGPIEVSFVARTDGVNIRLYAYGNEAVVWNWEANPAEMLVRRPTGAQTAVKAAPLDADRWYALRYVVTRQGMTISVDGAVVFAEAGDYRNAPRSHVMVHGWQDSTIDVKKLVVKPLD